MRRYKEKKPFFKRWWVWVVGIALIIAVVTPGGNDVDEAPVPEETESVEEKAPERSILETEEPDVEPEKEELPVKEEPVAAKAPSEEKVEEPTKAIPIIDESQDEVPAEVPVEEPVEDPIEEEPVDDSPIVYVSSRSSTIHSVSDCSGMKNYKEMTLNEALEKGCKYCDNCW